MQGDLEGLGQVCTAGSMQSCRGRKRRATSLPSFQCNVPRQDGKVGDEGRDNKCNGTYSSPTLTGVGSRGMDGAVLTTLKGLSLQSPASNDQHHQGGNARTAGKSPDHLDSPLSSSMAVVEMNSLSVVSVPVVSVSKTLFQSTLLQPIANIFATSRCCCCPYVLSRTLRVQ